MKKLYVSDVDNTLISEEHNEFSKRVIEVISLVQNNGSQFVLTSGRPTINLIEMAFELREKGAQVKYVAGYNGVELYDMDLGKVICDNGLSKEEVINICNILDEHNYNYMFYDKTALRTNVPTNEWAIREAKLCNLPIEDNSIKCSSPKVLLVVDEIENENIQEKLKKYLPNYEIFDSFSCFVEIQRKDINKATILKEVSEIENIKLENTYGFGDSGNDYELIRQANCGIVVENAKEELKKVADVVIGHVDQDSVCKFIESIEKVKG